MHDAEQGKMGRLRKILSGLSDIDSLVVNMFFKPQISFSCLRILHAFPHFSYTLCWFDDGGTHCMPSFMRVLVCHLSSAVPGGTGFNSDCFYFMLTRVGNHYWRWLLSLGC